MSDKPEIKKAAASDLLGHNLNNFSIQEYTEVFKIDTDGIKTSSLGYFKNESIAQAFAGNQVDSSWHRTKNVLLLTDGKVGFLVGGTVQIMDDEKAALEVREAALKKLSPAERKILGL